MTKHNHHRRSELFLVRMWTDDSEGSSQLAYGKVQRAVSGETNHFEDWEGLMERLKNMVAHDKRSKQDKAPDHAHEE